MSIGTAANGTHLPLNLPIPSIGDPPGTHAGDDAPEPFDRTLLIIDIRALDRECFAQSLVAHGVGMNVLHFGSIDEFRSRRKDLPPLSAVLLNVGGKRVGEALVRDQIGKLLAELGETPLILLADTDELPQIFQALELGVRGFIPTSVGINVCIEAIGLAMAGGVFVPASSVLAMRRLIESGNDMRPLAGMFTSRQAEVVEALRRGKANKIIAYELNLRESTVKVHIRNIMRKLKATNRTEVAFKINDLVPGYLPTIPPPHNPPPQAGWRD